MKDIKEKNGQLRRLIKEVLSENDTLTIATAGKNTPWVASLIYGFDKDFNLYFRSAKTTAFSRG